MQAQALGLDLESGLGEDVLPMEEAENMEEAESPKREIP